MKSQTRKLSSTKDLFWPDEQERDFGGLGVDLLDDRSLHLAGNYYSWLCQGKLRDPGALKHNILTTLITQVKFHSEPYCYCIYCI